MKLNYLIQFYILIFYIFENKEICNIKILKMFGLKGYRFYNTTNRNYICPSITKNCCTIEDQKLIIEKIIESESTNKEKIDLSINSWRLLEENINEFYTFEYYSHLKNWKNENLINILNSIINIKNWSILKEEVSNDFNIDFKFKEINNIVSDNWEKINKKFNNLSIIKVVFYKNFINVLSNNKHFLVDRYNFYISKKYNKTEIYNNLENDFSNCLNNNTKENIKKNKNYYISQIQSLLNNLNKESNIIKKIDSIIKNYKNISEKFLDYKKSIYCVLCDFNNEAYINFEEKEILIKTSFCKEIISFYKTKIMNKIKYIYKIIENIKNIIILLTDLNIKEISKFNSEINNSNILQNSIDLCLNYKDNNKNIETYNLKNCKSICEKFNLNKYNSLFDDFDPIFKIFTNLWIEFRNKFSTQKQSNDIINENLKEIKKDKTNRNLLLSESQIKTKIKDVKIKRNLKFYKNKDKNKLSLNKINSKDSKFKNKLYNSININNLKDATINVKSTKTKFIKNRNLKSISFLKKNKKSNKIINKKETKRSLFYDALNNLLYKYRNKLEKYEPIVSWLDRNYIKLEGNEMKYLRFIHHFQDYYNNNLKINISKKYNDDFKNKIYNLKIERIPKEFRLYNDEMNVYNTDLESKISLLYDYFNYFKKYKYEEIKDKIVKIMLDSNKLNLNGTDIYKIKKIMNISWDFDRINLKNPFNFKNFKDYKFEILESNNRINIFNFLPRYSSNGIDVIKLSGIMKNSSSTLNKINQIMNFKDLDDYKFKETSQVIKDIKKEYNSYKFSENFNNNYMLNFNTFYIDPSFYKNDEKIIKKSYKVSDESKLILKEDFIKDLTNFKIDNIFIFDVNNELLKQKEWYFDNIKKYYEN